jgi:hypothetical protein
LRTKSFDADLRVCTSSLLNVSLSLGFLVLIGKTAGAATQGAIRHIALTQGVDKGLEVQVANWHNHHVEDQSEEFRAKGPGACYNQAYRLLTRDEAIQLCTEQSSPETASCFTHAIQILPKNNAIRLCQGSLSQWAPLECFRGAQRSLPVEQAVNLCRHGGNLRNLECFDDASKTLSTQQSVQLCSGLVEQAKERLSCFRSAIQRFGVELALDQCDHS